MVKKFWGAGLLALCVCLSFFLGCRYGQGNERADREAVRGARYQALLSFSVDKLEELKGGYDPSGAAALASNVYAAYWHGPGGDALPGALHALWNALVFDGENLAGKEDALIEALRARNAGKVADIAREMRAPAE